MTETVLQRKQRIRGVRLTILDALRAGELTLDELNALVEDRASAQEVRALVMRLIREYVALAKYRPDGVRVITAWDRQVDLLRSRERAGNGPRRARPQHDGKVLSERAWRIA